MSDADFIEVTPGALSRDACAAIVARMRASRDLQPGEIGGGVYPDLKRSRDLAISEREDWADVAQGLNVAVFGGLVAYLRK
ncbi:hypothetical protein SB719_19510, partial [Pantoea sp. SIMBA_079]